MNTIRYLRDGYVGTLFIIGSLVLFVLYLINHTNSSSVFIIIAAYSFVNTMWRGQYLDEIKRLNDVIDILNDK